MPPESDPIPDIRDIVPPEVVTDPRLWIVLGVVAGLVVAALLGVAIVRAASRRRRLSPPPVPVPPEAAALAALEALERETPPRPPEEAAAAVERAVARFLHRKLGIPALYRTAEELTARRGPEDPPPLPGLAPFAPLYERLAELRFASPHRQGREVEALIAEARAVVSAHAGSPPASRRAP